MILTVTELNEYVGKLLGRDPILRDIRVVGEISGFKRHSSGHLYFSLKDESALIRCVMFRQAASTLTFRPVDGMRVTVGGYASLYPRDGQFQLYVKVMQTQGEGELYKNFMLLKSRLESEGYFDASRKRPIPMLPNCVGVVTSKTGAVLHDVVNVIRRRFPLMNILVRPVPVQGAGAAELIAEGIRAMNDIGLASVLIVCRGGGSMEDLWAFNERAVADAIYNSKIPVISAIGHETDFTIADFVADMRAPTPSAAAELCVPEYDALAYRIDELRRRLIRAPQSAIDAKRQTLKRLDGARASIRHSMELSAQTLDMRRARLMDITRARYNKERMELDKLMLRLEGNSPKRALKKGYALILDEKGGIVPCADKLIENGQYTVRMEGGSASATINGVELE